MFIKCGDINLHVLLDGPPGAPPLVLLHSLGTTAHLWDAQAADLARSFRVIRPDLRGHGLTQATPGPYSLKIFADDLTALLNQLGVQAFSLAGVSLGGLIAQYFTAANPDRVTALVLVDTAMALPPAQGWTDRAAAVRAQGVASIQDAVIARWVTPAALHTAETAGLRAMLCRTADEAYAASCEAIAAADLSTSTMGIETPTLIIVGDQDQSTPVAAARAMAEAIAGARLTILQNAAHIPNFEHAAALTAAMTAFLAPATTNFYESGLAVRKQVLGEAHVARSLAAATDFDQDFQNFITRTAWGGIWTRPGLDRRTRSLLTIAMMASLGHAEELKLHLRASKNTGATPADIAEVLLQVAAYAGIPAANAAVRHAKEIFAEIQP
jgi:3-oxoadipate enol-lactonase/4-carboxymuconolactone decarboxylase